MLELGHYVRCQLDTTDVAEVQIEARECRVDLAAQLPQGMASSARWAADFGIVILCQAGLMVQKLSQSIVQWNIAYVTHYAEAASVSVRHELGNAVLVDDKILESRLCRSWGEQLPCLLTGSKPPEIRVVKPA